MNKGGTTQNQTQTSSPPAWAMEALQTVGQVAPQLYRDKKGYNVYSGPTQAPMSDARLLGMNNLLAATGAGGLPPITNEGLLAQRDKLKSQVFPQGSNSNSNSNSDSASGQVVAYTDPVTGRQYSHRDGTFYTMDGARVIRANEFGQGFTDQELSGGVDFKGNRIAGSPRMGGYPGAPNTRDAYLKMIGGGQSAAPQAPQTGLLNSIAPQQSNGLWTPTIKDSGKY